jgi:hypothetical protein
MTACGRDVRIPVGIHSEPAEERGGYIRRVVVSGV